MPTAMEDLFRVLRGEKAADDSINNLVGLMMENPHAWGDMDVPITMLREKLSESPASGSWWKPSDIKKNADLYSQLIQLPWKQDALPESYKSTNISSVGLGSSPGVYGYIDPQYKEINIKDPSFSIYTHEKAHIMQQQKGHLLQEILKDALTPLGKTMATEYEIPYSNRPREIQANAFSSFINQFMGKEGEGVNPLEPLLKLFRSGYETDKTITSNRSYMMK